MPIAHPDRHRLPALALIAALAGCSGNGATSALVPQAAGEAAAVPARTDGTMYVVSRDSNAVLGYPRLAQGNVAPTVQITGRKTQLSEPDALALDGKSGKIYVVNDGGQGQPSQRVLIFPRGAHGNVAPQIIAGSKVPFQNCEGVALDASGNIYVSDYQAKAIYVFPAGATGNVAPIRRIFGGKTLITDPTGLAFDASGNLWVTNAFNTSAPLLKFAPNAHGNVAPIATIGGSKTKLTGNLFNAVVAPNGHIIVTNDTSVEVFAPGSHGNVAPSATISGPATTLASVGSAGTDYTSNIYATNYSSGTYSIVAFAAHAHGDQAPLRVISGSNTLINEAVYPSFY